MTFAHLTLATVDVETSSLFFQNTLGWTPISQPDNIDRNANWLNITENQQLHLLLVEEFEPSPFEAEFGRHFAIFQPGCEFPELKQRLVDHGATLIDPLRATPFERFFFQDPNGYVFEVIDQDGYQQE
jgi:catechol 2,3-dioxygenase-like lactoylglutathione lyase family enzyme